MSPGASVSKAIRKDRPHRRIQTQHRDCRAGADGCCSPEILMGKYEEPLLVHCFDANLGRVSDGSLTKRSVVPVVEVHDNKATGSWRLEKCDARYAVFRSRRKRDTSRSG